MHEKWCMLMPMLLIREADLGSEALQPSCCISFWEIKYIMLYFFIILWCIHGSIFWKFIHQSFCLLHAFHILKNIKTYLFLVLRPISLRPLIYIVHVVFNASYSPAFIEMLIKNKKCIGNTLVLLKVNW